jgi:putative colanic acid biosynthesis UDP-glucose lipid carrier transferase
MTTITSIGRRAEREAREPNLRPVHVTSLRPIHTVHRRCSYDYKFAFRPVGGALKRTFDICAGSAALIALSPLLLFVALIIKLTSPGPALFRQARSGYRGRVFEIFKFRTMVAPRVTTAGPVVQTREDDPRVTWFGRFLRRTSIDELPQLLNVVAGEMSLVGPRPHALAHDRVFYGVNMMYPRRFHARPGITGLAQVAGARGRTDTAEKVETRLSLDLDYVERWSIWLDLLIIAKTVKLLFSDRNAF